MGKSKQKHICFVSQAAFGAMSGDPRGHIGGVERQTKMLADKFDREGFRVSVITWAQQGEFNTEFGGVNWIPLCRENAGIPILRFFYPRWTSLIAALKRANADVYYQNCAEATTGQIAIWSKIRKRKFIFSVASDPEVMSGFPDLKSWRERLLFGFGLNNADGIIVQKQWQQENLLKNFDLASTVLPMPADPSAVGGFRDEGQLENSSIRVCWIGRIAPVKRPEVLLDIATALPGIQFEMIGPVDSSDNYADPILARARQLKNVEYRGRVEYADIPSVYSRTNVLLCTSEFEGFPNTFVEAWAHKIPVVSSVDPDNLLKQNSIGDSFATTSEAIRVLSDIANNLDDALAKGARARKFYLENHEPTIALRRFTNYVRDILANNS